MNVKFNQAAILLGISILVASPAFADKPDSPGKSGKQKSSHEYQDSHYYFDDDRSQRIRNYYSESKKSGNCPPGLAKKHNGCRPPGQVKQWHKGQPLPRDVVYYDVPYSLRHQLGRTPEGQKLVRVGTDILLISIGTGMVLDAVQDLDDLF